MTVGLTSDVFGGVFGLGFLVLSYCFELGSHDRNYLPNVHFSRDGASDIVTSVPQTNYPLLAIYLFPILNWKMFVGSTDQHPIMFEEGCQDQLACLEGMVLAFFISRSNPTLLKRYPRLHPCLWILVMKN